MRRIVLWVLSTLTALVLLFGYSTSTSGPLATGSPPSVTSRAAAGATAPGTTSESPSEPPSESPSGSESESQSVAGGTTTATGSVASTQWGPVQVELTVADGTITQVDVVQYPSDNPKDQEINDYALPILTQETLDAQGADIDMVSGATVTSNGYVESLQSALDQAHL